MCGIAGSELGVWEKVLPRKAVSIYYVRATTRHYYSCLLYLSSSCDDTKIMSFGDSTCYCPISPISYVPVPPEVAPCLATVVRQRVPIASYQGTPVYEPRSMLKKGQQAHKSTMHYVHGISSSNVLYDMTRRWVWGPSPSIGIYIMCKCSPQCSE